MTTSIDLPTLSPDDRRSFGRTGLHVSPLGFGGAPIGNLETDGAVVRDILHALLDHGVNLIDTAHVYHGSEAAIGAAVAGRRDDFVLVSKCGSKWNDDDDLGPAWSPEYITATIDRSLQRLGTDVIDVMLLHSCELSVLQDGAALDAVLAARQAGKVRFAGYSGDNDAAAWAATHPEIAVIQTSLSLCDQNNADAVLPNAATHGIGIMAKRPVANGAWKTRDAQHQRYLRYAEPYHDRFAQLGLDLGAVRAAADDDTLEWPEIALRFTLALDGVHTAIVGTTSVRNTHANLRAAARGALPAPAVTLIRDAWRAADPDRTWPGLT